MVCNHCKKKDKEKEQIRKLLVKANLSMQKHCDRQEARIIELEKCLETGREITRAREACIRKLETENKKLEKRNTQLCLDLSMADECLQERKEQIRKLEAENKKLKKGIVAIFNEVKICYDYYEPIGTNLFDDIKKLKEGLK